MTFVNTSIQPPTLLSCPKLIIALRQQQHSLLLHVSLYKPASLSSKPKNPRKSQSFWVLLFRVVLILEGMMMVGEEDLGLSLSLSFSVHGEDGRGGVVVGHRLQQQIPAHHYGQPFVPSNGSFERNLGSIQVEPQPLLRGIDVNRIPCTTEDVEDELGISSPNSTVSSISGNKRGDRDVTLNGEDHEIERACSQGMSDEDDGGGDASRKKLRLSKDQSAILEETFREHCTLHPKQKVALAKQLGLRTRQVEVWFQNRRARTKLKQTEVDCEFLRRCCENLTDENRRLQKEVQELRTLKLSPQFYMQMTPPTTLTMCPSCERVGLPSPALHRPVNMNLSLSAQSGPFVPNC